MCCPSGEICGSEATCMLKMSSAFRPGRFGSAAAIAVAATSTSENQICNRKQCMVYLLELGLDRLAAPCTAGTREPSPAKKIGGNCTAISGHVAGQPPLAALQGSLHKRRCF